MKKLSVLLLFFFLFLNYDNAGRAQTTIMIGGTEYQVDTLSHLKVVPALIILLCIIILPVSDSGLFFWR